MRDERDGDAAAIAALTTRAFALAEHASGTEAAIVDALRAAGALTLSLVAAEDGAIVGHVALSPVRIDGAAGGWFGLGPLSVDPARQRRGIGAGLVEAAIARLRASGAAGCVLLGDPAYYRRFGFTSDPTLHYGDTPSPYFQNLPLAGPAARGQVSYHPAFDAG
ncbi:GNAT family N-acetyltransferase [Rhizorhabdus wittichii]|uniref:GNAT family N-acetyltransferase n=1 Tax=Rhizorhabdus wittichii TaxID=160791 RepID=UPI003857BFB7